MSDDARAALAVQQRQLIDALAGGSMPAGFDSVRVALAGRTLVSKRRRAVERRWAALAATPGFAEQFAEYARQCPLPTGGAVADGTAFYDRLAATGAVTDSARVERAAFDASRRWFVVRRLHDAARWAVAVRLPPFGVRVIRFGRR